MRQRTKMNGLVSHTTPNGKSHTSGENRCRMNLQKLEKLVADGYQITGVKKNPANQEENFKIVMVFGKPMKLTIQEYNDHWNFRIDK